ncbi:endonuclease/exonuclease/phosphatase family protein [Mesorhizobium sp.]|nr:endonuclease/exonuclease/phosphatase family protein [Mesorhizobium sp.]
MTFNVQMLPLVATAIEGQNDRAKAIANDVANALLGLPADERPDVIALNEVFNEEGRSQLMSRLSGTWPNVIDKIFDGLFEDDSGLMLFSRLPLLPLPTGGIHFEHIYEAHNGADSLASKAVGIVQVGTPVDRTTIAFTHLQASYQTEDEFASIRAKQLDAIFHAVDKVLEQQPGRRGKVIIMGDLNIRGDSGAASSEWGSIFEGGGSLLFGPYQDGWKAYMHPPGTDGLDEGVTNIAFKTGVRQRLDYICFAKPGQADILLVAQHMRVRLKNSSDHFALEAVVHQISDHNRPADAKDGLSIMPSAGGTPGQPTTVRRIDVQFEHDGSYQWIFVKTPGTYTFHKTDGFRIEVYFASNLSHSVKRLDTLDFRLLPSALQGAFDRHEIDPRGDTFLSREPFFILVKSTPGYTGGATVWMTEHMGESDTTAIALRLFDRVNSSFPAGQRLGDDDLCWFRADMARTLQSVPRPETFQVHNPSGGSITVDLRNAAHQRVAPPESGNGGSLTTSTSVTGGERIFLTIRRQALSLTGFTVEWRSPVTYLDLDEPITFFINDESGVDYGGADEPELQVNIDTGPPLFLGSWDDADSGERWPGLGEAIVAKLATLMPGERRVGFVEGIWLGYVEPDISAQGWQTVSINPLTQGEEDRGERTATLHVPDEIKDGLYTFSCTLTRFP